MSDLRELATLTTREIAAVLRGLEMDVFIAAMLQRAYDGDVLCALSLSDLDRICPRADPVKKASLLRKRDRLSAHGVPLSLIAADATTPPLARFVACDCNDGVDCAQRDARALLRRGAFGPTYKMRSADGLVYAATVATASAPQVRAVVEAMAHLSTLRQHPNITRYLGTQYLGGTAWIRTELCVRTLADVVAAAATLRGKARGQWHQRIPSLLEGAASGVAFLHAHDVVHGALDLASVLVAADERVCVSLCERRGSGSESGSGGAARRTGALFAAPETLEEARGEGAPGAQPPPCEQRPTPAPAPARKPADVWALGLIALEVAGAPLSAVAEDVPLGARACAAHLAELTSRATRALTHLAPAITGMLRRDPALRSTAAAAFTPALRVLVHCAETMPGPRAADISLCARLEVDAIKRAHCEPGRPRCGCPIQTLRNGGPRDAWAELERGVERTGSDYDVFHFIGHGGIPNEIGEMTLAFKAKKAARGAARGDAAEGGGSRSGARESGRPGDGEASLCTHDTIVRMLRSAAKERSLKVAVLMACNTRAIALRLANEARVAHVIAWRSALDNAAAVVFSSHFHRGLHDGLDAPRAFRRAMTMMRMAPEASGMHYAFDDPDDAILLADGVGAAQQRVTRVGLPILLAAPPLIAAPTLGGMASGDAPLSGDAEDAMWTLYSAFFGRDKSKRVQTAGGYPTCGLVANEVGGDATRVAQHYASEFSGMYPGGTFCVDLGTCADPRERAAHFFADVERLLAGSSVGGGLSGDIVSARGATSGEMGGALAGAEGGEKATLLVATGVGSAETARAWIQLLGERDLGRCDVVIASTLPRAELSSVFSELLGDAPIVVVEPVARVAHRVFCVCALRDGRIASAGDDGAITLWRSVDEERRRLVRSATLGQYGAPGCFVWTLAQLEDGRLASGGHNASNTILIWTLRQRHSAGGACDMRLSGHLRTVRAVAALPHAYLASCSDDATVRIWRTSRRDDERAPRRVFERGALCVLRGHRNNVYDLAQVRGFASFQLASSGHDGTVRLWHLWDPADVDGEAGEWGADDEEPTARFEAQLRAAAQVGALPHHKLVNCVAQLRDGRLASAGTGRGGHTVRVWNLAELDRAARAGTDLRSKFVPAVELCGHGEAVNDVASLSTTQLVSCGSDGTVRVWALDGARRDANVSSASDASTHVRCIIGSHATLYGHADSVYGLCVARGCIVSVSEDKTVLLWAARRESEVGDTPARGETAARDAANVNAIDDGALPTHLDAWRGVLPSGLNGWLSEAP